MSAAADPRGPVHTPGGCTRVVDPPAGAGPAGWYCNQPAAPGRRECARHARASQRAARTALTRNAGPAARRATNPNRKGTS